MSAGLFAALALVPAMLGPSALAGHGAVLTARLCGAGGAAAAVTIPLPGKAPATPAPCEQKGCHAGTRSCHDGGKRKRIDSTQ